MNDITNQFFDWLDETGLKPVDVAETLGNSPATVSTWKSKGIPKSKQQLCLMMINQSHAKHDHEPKVSFTLHPTYEEFRTWNKASLAAGMIVEDWAESVMNSAAAKHLNKNNNNE